MTESKKIFLIRRIFRAEHTYSRFLRCHFSTTFYIKKDWRVNRLEGLEKTAGQSLGSQSPFCTNTFPSDIMGIQKMCSQW